MLVGDETKTVDLIPNGAEQYVTVANREEFVRLFIQFEVETQAKTRFDAFWKGLARFIDPLILRSLLEIEELPILISGQQKLNFAELKSGARYGNGFTPEHR